VSITAPAAPLHLPPYPVPNLVGQLTDPANAQSGIQRVTENGQTYVSAQLVVVNGGTKTMRGGKLRFYLSEDKKANTVNGTAPDPLNPSATILNPKDQLVTIGGGPEVALPGLAPTGGVQEVALPTLAPNSGIRFVFEKKNIFQDHRLKFPAGEGGEGLNLLAHFDYSDPIGDNLPIGHDVVVGPFNPFIVQPTSISVQESATTGTSATFTIKLAKQPRADVTIPITLDSTATSRVTLSASSVTFTANDDTWKTGQQVTISAIQNSGSSTSVTVTLGTASSSDVRFNLMAPSNVVVAVKAN
jgi:hypothetical protein